MEDQDGALGLFLGLACGDALGRPVEFRSAAQIEQSHGRVTEMLADGTHGQPAGTITDDTEMALCIARSLVEHGDFEPADVAARFVEWYESGPFDIGLMTADSLRKIQAGASWDDAGQSVWENRPEGQNAGNGSVMRCAPYAIAYRDNPKRLTEVSRQSSAITHADPRCSWGCAILNQTLAGLLRGEPNPLESALDELGSESPDELVEALERVSQSITSDQLQSTGYVVHTLQTALYHGLTGSSAEDAITTAVNMGGDTDTVGAVTGAVAGARFGASALPNRWCSALSHREEIHDLVAKIHKI